MFPFSSMNIDKINMYEQDDHNQEDHQMKKINGCSSIVGDDQFMGPRSVEERFNDKQYNLLIQFDLGQIREPHENKLNPKQNTES
jgi:hypothetical protein